MATLRKKTSPKAKADPATTAETISFVIPLMSTRYTVSGAAIEDALNKSAMLRQVAEVQARQFSKALDGSKMPEEWHVRFTIEARPGKM